MNLVPKYVALNAEQYAKVESCIDNGLFTEKKPLYVVTSQPKCEGAVLYVTVDRVKAKRKCFTKNKKVRKAYYTKFEFSKVLPFHLIEELNKELGL